jgi:hypothetical protein
MLVLVLLLMLDGARCERQRGSDRYRGGLSAGPPGRCGRDHLLLLLAMDRPAL